MKDTEVRPDPDSWDYYDCRPETPEEEYSPFLKELIEKDKNQEKDQD